MLGPIVEPKLTLKIEEPDNQGTSKDKEKSVNTLN